MYIFMQGDFTMKLKNALLSLFSLSLLSLLAGCAGYKAKPLSRLTTGAPAAQDETISMAYHLLTKDDCKKYLDRDVLKKGYQPIHITIRNNASRALMLSIDNISIPCVTVQEVAEKVRTNTALRALGYGVAGAVCLPLGLTTPPLTVPLTVTSGVFMLSSLIDGSKSAGANKRLYADFMHKELKDQLIKPLSVVNGLIFVPAVDFNKDDFAITLFDAQDGMPFVLTAHEPRLKIVKQPQPCRHRNHIHEDDCVIDEK